MPIQVASETYIGNGKIGIEKLSTKDGHRYAGGSLEMTLTIESEEKTTPNLEDTSGGNLNKISRISKISGTLNLQEFRVRNLAIALRSLIAEELGGPVSGELHTFYPDSLVLLNKLVDTESPIIVNIASNPWTASTAYSVGNVITDIGDAYICIVAGISDASSPAFDNTLGAETVDGTVTWECIGPLDLADGTDYQFTGTCLQTQNLDKFENGLPVSIDYTANDASVIEMLTDGQSEYSIVFGGVNAASNDNPFPTALYRVKFDPVSGLPFKGQEFANLSLTFECLPDSTKVGSGISKYGQFRKAKV